MWCCTIQMEVGGCAYRCVGWVVVKFFSLLFVAKQMGGGLLQLVAYGAQDVYLKM